MRSFLSLPARLLDAVYAPGCAACDAAVASGQPLCPECAGSLEPLGAACPRCALPSSEPVPCDRCVRRPPPFDAMAAPFVYVDAMGAALRRLKFGGRRDVARTLAPLLAGPLARAAAGCDLLVPVPLHRRRLAARGFNQAALLLRHARAAGGPPADVLSLRRVRATAPQTGLDARGRRRNVEAAFVVAAGRRARVAGRRVLLFDDIVTTGATMAEAAAALRAAGAVAVVGLCAARAPS